MDELNKEDVACIYNGMLVIKNEKILPFAITMGGP